MVESYSYKTVHSEGGTKHHVVHSINEETGEIDILCDIGVDPNKDNKISWETKREMYESDEVCENCKKEIFDAVGIEEFEKPSDEQSKENQNILSKIFSAIPWV
jgi:hypothetical protein